MAIRIIALILTLLVGTPALSAADSDSPTTEELLAHPDVVGALAIVDAWIESKQLFERIPGISVGIVHDQDLIWAGNYGHANLATKRPTDSDTLYSICSISKLFTAIGIMQLRDNDQLELRDSVSDHLDWFEIDQSHAQSGPITIEGLLTHASGLPRESDFAYWTDPDFPFPTRSQMIERLKSQSTLYPAQKYFQYSNLAWSLAGEIIRERSGQDYDTYIRDKILNPLQLDETYTFFPEDLYGESLAIGYHGLQRDLKRDPVNPFFTRGITAAAGFTSSVNDLAKFASWQFRLLENGGNEVLAANTLREMQRVHWVDPDWELTWGLGFNVRRDAEKTLVSHGGGCPGYITSFTMVPSEKTAAIVLTNAGDGPAGNIAVNILNIIGPALQKAATPNEDALPDFSAYAGNYEGRPWGGEYAVRQWGDKLAVINVPSNSLKDATIRLEHVEGNTFIRLSDDDEQREQWKFELEDSSKVATRVLVHSNHSMRVE
jgi:CubicO group peptidase (beta-lactamase class C family)